MERIRSINVARLHWCCADRGMTLGELAREVGISPATLNRLQAGEDGLTFRQLREIAIFFGRGALFFLEPGPVNEEKAHSPQFRTLANQKAQLSPQVKLLIERVERQRSIFLALRDELAPEEVRRFSPPALDGLSVQDAAAAVRRWLELPARNDFESYRNAIEAKGLLVFQSNGYAGKWQIAKESPISGFALYDPACPVIVVKKQDASSRQSFTLMHELGHVLLHRASWIDDDEDLHSHHGQEREANAFAGLVLIPDDFLASIRDGERPADVAGFNDWLQPQCRAWGVSAEAILRRLLDAGRLSRDEYAAYRQWWKGQSKKTEERGSREYRNREPKHIFGEGYVRTVLDALSARRISLAKASTYLDNLKISDLHKLERHCAGV